jgi:hypothetical protein
MRRWIIVASLGMNALLGVVVLLKLWYQAGWGHAVRLSATEARLLIVVAAAALALDLVLVPVLGISFWARDRGTRRLEARVASLAPPVASNAAVDDGLGA